jgi:hypothetical protein
MDRCPGRNISAYPAKTIHDFANRTTQQAGVLNFFIPGGFERNMPSIVQWFAENK